jgi:hypothetical protein
MLKSLFKASLVVATASALLAAGGLAATPKAAAAAVPVRPLGSTATFTHFSVTVQGTVMDPEHHGYMVKLRVCVRSLPPGSTGGRTRISRDPWTVSAGGRTHRPSAQENPPDTFPRPYRTEGRFRVGECATGWLPFWSVAGAKVTSINYANSLGNRARWQSEPLRLGSTATFQHFTVRVSAVELTTYWIGVLATTCVRSVPYGRKTVRISSDPWSLTTSPGNVSLGVTQEGSRPWRSIYPEETRLAKGQCVTGWLAFDHRRREVRSVGYSNSLGDRASWRI